MAAIVDAGKESRSLARSGAGRSRGYSRVYPARGESTADEMVQVSAPAASRAGGEAKATTWLTTPTVPAAALPRPPRR